MELLVKENNELKTQLVLAMERNNMIPETTDKFEVKGLLKILLECAKHNADKKPGGRRFDNTIKELGTLLFIIGGRQLYEILYCNLVLPSITTVKAHLDNTVFIKEGEFRFPALKEFLRRRDFPMKIWLSEDGTHINGRIQYCPKTNQIVGFVLPLDENGLPVIGNFPATSGEVIKSYFDNSHTSNVVYCIIAKPLVNKSPSFCLAMFGTDNRFTSTDVVKRWAWMKREAKEYGIEIIGISSDGDEKLLKAMLYKSVTLSSKEWPFFSCNLSQDIVFIQDTVHLAAKLKTRLIKPSIILPFGKYLASRGHLSELINTQSSDLHKLSSCLLNPRDKMNFAAVEKLSDKRVTDLLRKCVTGSEGTATYLDMIREVMSAFLKPSLTPAERIVLLWKWVFFARIWRKWIAGNPDYSLEHNFITRNAYKCLELNAHGLVQIIRKLRDSGDEELFIPQNFDSQPCESSFRELRSMTSTYSTVVNVSVLGFQHRVRRIDFVAESKLNLSDLIFPRNARVIASSSDTPYAVTTLPGDAEIEKNIREAFKKAIVLSTDMGICKGNVALPHSAVSVISLPELDRHDEEESNSDTEFDDNPDNDLSTSNEPSGSSANSNKCDEEEDQNQAMQLLEEDLLMVSSGALGLKTFENVDISPNSLYVLVKDGEGKSSYITKQSLVCLLSSGNTKMSSDRLLRVQTQSVSHNKELWCSEQRTSPTFEDTISLGDWCAFLEEDGHGICAGRILAFSYESGHTWSQQEYRGFSVSTRPAAENARGVECLCSWFKINKKTMELTPIIMEVHGFYSVKNYKCTLPRPKPSGNQRKLILPCTFAQISKVKKK